MRYECQVIIMCNLECDWAAIMFNLHYCVLYVLFQLSAHCVIKIRHGLQEKDFFCFWLELKNALMSWRLCVCWKSMWASVKTQKHNSLCKFVRYFRWSLHKGIRCRDVIKISSFPCTLSVLSPLDRRQSTKARTLLSTKAHTVLDHKFPFTEAGHPGERGEAGKEKVWLGLGLAEESRWFVHGRGRKAAHKTSKIVYMHKFSILHVLHWTFLVLSMQPHILFS